MTTTNICFHWLIGRSSTLRNKFGVTSHARESSYEEKYRDKDDNSTSITPDDDAMEIDDVPSYVRESRNNLSQWRFLHNMQ